jgi:UPF0716 protein FxsA
MWFPLLLLLWPLVEIALFVIVGGWIGLWPTLAIVVGTAVLGVWLIRSQGLRAGEAVRRAMAARSDPAAALAEGALGLAAALLLILPGFLTDAMGLLLLIPPVRAMVAAALARRAGNVRMVRVAAAGGPPRSGPEVIDGTWEELPEAERRNPPSGWTRH